jgi:hypothetical protein
LEVVTLARKRIDISVFDLFDPANQYAYQAKARDESGREVASAYGKTRQDAIAKVVQRVRSSYPDAAILY